MVIYPVAHYRNGMKFVASICTRDVLLPLVTYARHVSLFFCSTILSSLFFAVLIREPCTKWVSLVKVKRSRGCFTREKWCYRRTIFEFDIDFLSRNRVPAIIQRTDSGSRCGAISIIERSYHGRTFANPDADGVNLWNFYVKQWQSVKGDGIISKITSGVNRKLDNRHGLRALAGLYEEVLEGAAGAQESACKCCTLCTS